MTNLATLRTLVDLEREMARLGRTSERSALREALQALIRPGQFMTPRLAAERLGIPVASVKRWVQRGTLVGGPLGGRWVVSSESVDQIVWMREALLVLEEEGYPPEEALQSLFEPRRTDRSERLAGT